MTNGTTAQQPTRNDVGSLTWDGTDDRLVALFGGIPIADYTIFALWRIAVSRRLFDLNFGGGLIWMRAAPNPNQQHYYEVSKIVGGVTQNQGWNPKPVSGSLEWVVLRGRIEPSAPRLETWTSMGEPGGFGGSGNYGNPTGYTLPLQSIEIGRDSGIGNRPYLYDLHTMLIWDRIISDQEVGMCIAYATDAGAI
jgi:hypothetical protein